MSADIKVTDGTILEALNNKVDIDFDNVASNSVSFARMSREVTNCITEIPQRIKYTLEDGTLTIKAGTVVIVPYGTEDLTSQYPKGATFLNNNFKVYDTQYEDGKFFVWAEVVNDVSVSIPKDAYTFFLCCVPESNSFGYRMETSRCFSGDTSKAPEYGYLYNTTNNNIEFYNNSTLTRSNISFPIMICTSTNNAFSSIDQVFNGMGYIGYNIWVDKGVKVLIPDGKNADGTLKNIEYTTDKLFVTDYSAGAKTQFYYALSNKNGILNNKQVLSILKTRFHMGEVAPTGVNASSVFYNTGENQFYVTTDGTNWQKESLCIISNYFNINETAIGWLTINEPTRILKSSDKFEISGFGMPSHKYIALTLGASSSSYTAPANGWIAISKNATAGSQYLCIYRSFLRTQAHSSANGQFLEIYAPVRRGEKFTITYTAGGTTNIFNFIYAEGEI